MPKTPEGFRDAWLVVERAWRSTCSRAKTLPESALHESVNGEWSFVETQRHLLFATDVWVRRSVLDEPGAYHRLGMPPDLRTGQADPGGAVSQWGIDVWATPSLDEVLDARAEYMSLVREVVDDLTHDKLSQPSAHNPPWMPPDAVVPLSVCLRVVIREEWEHHGFATRDLAVLEKQL